MACFLAPLSTAIAVTSVKKKIPKRYHIEWLLMMLWGGVAWLIPEHIYHGEVVMYPPFFTAGFSEITSEVVKVGVPMVVPVVIIWLMILVAATFFQRRKFRPNPITLVLCGALVIFLVDRIFS